jgi:hypothetical protein
MKRILICTGVLGSGTALTFAAAMLAATLMPGGTVIPATNPNVGFRMGGGAQFGGGVPVAVPWPANGVTVGPDVNVMMPAPTVGP